MLEVPGQAIMSLKKPAWKDLAGAGSGRDLMEAFAADKQTERKREDSRSGRAESRRPIKVAKLLS
jgi:hypothetical protein